LREVQTVLEGSTGPVLEGSGQETILILLDERIQNESTHGERGEFSKVGPKDLAKDQHSTNPHTAAGTHADAGRPLADPQTTVGQPVVPSSHWPAAGKKSSPATGASFSGAHKPQEAAGAAIPSGPVPAAPARSRKPKRKKDELSPAPKTYSEKTKAYCLSLLDAFPQEWTTKHHKAGDDPAARQKSDWAEALDKLDRLLKAGIDPNYLVIRAGMYADEMATKNKEAQFIKTPENWLYMIEQEWTTEAGQRAYSQWQDGTKPKTEYEEILAAHSHVNDANVEVLRQQCEEATSAY
jgi:hypothetical protein